LNSTNNGSGQAPQDTGGGETTFARDLGLFDATMIGVGAMIGAGIFVLTGIAAGVSGPASILAFALNGVVTLLTAFAYAELASAIPRAGGGYSYVRLAFPGAMGFISGWMLWFAYTVACSLYARSFTSTCPGSPSFCSAQPEATYPSPLSQLPSVSSFSASTFAAHR
jgi:amino acid transporter